MHTLKSPAPEADPNDVPHAWTPEAFVRIDAEPDTRFYQHPRFVNHIDDEAIAAVTAAIQRSVPPGADVLDLMCSWVSHLPDPAALPLGRVIGLGMNAAELAGNPRLESWTTQDLNRDPHLPYPDSHFDGVLINVSIQYLTRPDLVLREVARVLRSNGVVIVTFSNRMFPTKAVHIWRETTDSERPRLVAAYLAAAGSFDPPEFTEHRPRRGWSGGDPLWAVVAHKTIADNATPDGKGRRPASSEGAD